MSLALLAAVAGLVGAGVYLITSRSLSRIVLGFSLLGHAAVLSLLTAGGPAGAPPVVDAAGNAGELAVNPLPQALSLTAIVISFGLTLFLLALARSQNQIDGDDLVEDDLEDRRIATTEAELDDDVETDVFDEDDEDEGDDEVDLPASGGGDSGDAAAVAARSEGVR